MIAIDLSDFAVAFTGQFSPRSHTVRWSGECMLTKLGTKNDVSREVVDAMACNVEVEIPDKAMGMRSTWGPIRVRGNQTGLWRGTPHPHNKLHPRMYASEFVGTALLVFVGLSIVKN